MNTKAEVNKGLVSVIIPIYNVEKYVYKCLDSVKKQTYKNIEVIAVNDGATDSSGEIARNFCESDDRYIYIEKPNGGLSSARNTGLDNASGEFIIFIDSDDWLMPSYVEEMICAFEDDVDIVIGKYKNQDNDFGVISEPNYKENITRVFKDKEKEKEILERHLAAYPNSGYLINTSLMPVWKNVYKHEFIKRHNLRFVSEREVMAEDYVFNMEAYYFADSVKFVPVSGYIHLIVKNSLSRSYRKNAFEMSENRIKVVENFIDTHSFYDVDSVKKAAMDFYVANYSYDIFNLSCSNETNKLQLLKKRLPDKHIKDYIKNNVINIEKRFRICISIMKTGKPALIVILNNLLNIVRRILKKTERVLIRR